MRVYIYVYIYTQFCRLVTTQTIFIYSEDVAKAIRLLHITILQYAYDTSDEKSLYARMKLFDGFWSKDEHRQTKEIEIGAWKDNK